MPSNDKRAVPSHFFVEVHICLQSSVFQLDYTTRKSLKSHTLWSIYPESMPPGSVLLALFLDITHQGPYFDCLKSQVLYLNLWHWGMANTVWPLKTTKWHWPRLRVLSQCTRPGIWLDNQIRAPRNPVNFTERAHCCSGRIILEAFKDKRTIFTRIMYLRTSNQCSIP